jgi:hypothetical protein
MEETLLDERCFIGRSAAVDVKKLPWGKIWVMTVHWKGELSRGRVNLTTQYAANLETVPHIYINLGSTRRIIRVNDFLWKPGWSALYQI